MLKLPLLELFLRGIPEGFLIIFSVYAFSKTVVNKKRYLISSIIFLVAVYLIRLLPIQFAVHTILGLIMTIVLTVNINKIPIIKSIQACIVATIVESICEGLNILVIQYVFGLDINYVFNEPTLKIVFGIPSLLIFACIAIFYYISKFKRKELRDVFNGEIS